MEEVSTAWGIGLIAGPAVGGFFAQPAEKYPLIVSKESLLGRFPYLLPCFCISFFAFCVFLACFWLPETLHTHRKKVENRSYENIETSEDGYDLKENKDETTEDTNKSLLKNWPLVSCIIVFCIFSLHDMAYTEIFSLWAESDQKHGGLSFSSQDVGEVLAISGFTLLVFQLLWYPKIEKVFGPLIVSHFAAILSIPLLATYPFFSKLSGLGLSLIVNSASMLKNVLSVTVITGIVLVQNNTVNQNQRAAANGLSMTAMSLFKAIAPAGGGAIFALAQEHQNGAFLPGDHMVFFMLNIVELLGILLTLKPFLRLASSSYRM